MGRIFLRATMAGLLMGLATAMVAAQTGSPGAGGPTTTASKVAGKTKVPKAAVKPKRSRAVTKPALKQASSEKTLATQRRERARRERQAQASAAEAAGNARKP